MSCIFRHYYANSRFTQDFIKIRNFLIRINEESLATVNYPFGRWEWMNSLENHSKENMEKIGIWEDAGIIVGVAVFESELGDTWLITDPLYTHLKREMLDYAIVNMVGEKGFRLSINRNDTELQAIAAEYNFIPTDHHEPDSFIEISELTDYQLPEGFSIVSLKERYDIKEYNRVLWRGFNHPGEASTDDLTLKGRIQSISGPDVNLDLNIAVVAPNGHFVSYCGMWHIPKTKYALVEPVATDPDYRKMGLGKAAVIEAIKRCGKAGAKYAFVGSSQEFYYHIGFKPYSANTWWIQSK
ncbi:MAG: hypothetical protein CVV58_03430 [Tenericutes bacterium HGW-Tenericutes-3]|nr:MAG: hypothetical protein CVV58_03430 [Tenericutes bacterium HGW-Tenericutes-3]